MGRLPVAAWLGLMVSLGAAPSATAADVVVGTGTPATCSEGAFDAGLVVAHNGTGGTMSFNCGGAAAIVFTSQKVIAKSITVNGAGVVTLSGGNSTRLFSVPASGTLTLRAIGLTNGFAAGDGGAIANFGAVVIENSTIRNSHTVSAFSGGAIISYGPLTITGSLLEGNSAGGGGALYVRFEAGDAVITNSTLRDNRAVSTTSGWGGAILVWDGADITLHGVTIANNQAQRGGGIDNAFANSSVVIDGGSIVSGNSATNAVPGANTRGGGLNTAGDLSLVDSTVSGNQSNSGGGIFNAGAATLTRVTVSGNSADYGAGVNHSGGSIAITNTTISGNIGGVGGGMQVNASGASLVNVTLQGNIGSVGGGVWTATATVTLKNTILAGSVGGGNCSGLSAVSFASQGFNLSSDASCANLTQGGDRTNQNPLIGPLTSNGGPTQTHLPAAASPAVDAGTPTGAPALDQRGRPRPSGLAVDIGAVERQPSDSPPTTVQPPADLRVSAMAGNLVTFRFAPNPLGPAATGFVLEGGVASGAVQAIIPTGSAVPVFSIEVPTGSFHVRMRATRGPETSGTSNEIPIHVNLPVPPSAPDLFSAVVNGDSLALSWRNTFAGGPPAGTILDVSGTFSVQVPLGAAESFAVNGVPPGSYTLRLRSLNNGGTGPLSAPVSITIPSACSGPPGPPSNVLGYRVGNTVSVLWDPPASGPAASSYILNVTGSFVGGFATATRALSGQVGPGSYTMNVVAVNPCGASAATAPQTVVVP